MRAGANPALILCKWRLDWVAALLDLNVDLYVVLDESDTKRADFDWGLLKKVKDAYRVGDFDSIEEITAVGVDLKVRGVAVTQVISTSETCQLGAVVLRELFGCAPVDLLVQAASRDKRMMKHLVAGAGVPTAAWLSLPATLDGLDEAALDAVGFPAVVKPAFGFGTMSTVRVGDLQDLVPVINQISDIPGTRSKHLIIEEFVHGRELHVDALWHEGQPLFLAVSAYHEPRLAHVEKQSCGKEERIPDGSFLIPVDEDPDLHRRVLDLHQQVNGALGVETTVTHLELFETESGDLVFSEMATRLGGGWAPDVLSAHLGYSVYTALASGIVHGVIPEGRPLRRYLGALHLQPESPGRISAMPSDEEIQKIAGVLGWRRAKQVGDEVTFQHGMDWCLIIVIGADDRDAYSDVARRVERSLSIETSALA